MVLDQLHHFPALVLRLIDPDHIGKPDGHILGFDIFFLKLRKSPPENDHVEVHEDHGVEDDHQDLKRQLRERDVPVIAFEGGHAPDRSQDQDRGRRDDRDLDPMVQKE